MHSHSGLLPCSCLLLFAVQARKCFAFPRCLCFALSKSSQIKYALQAGNFICSSFGTAHCLHSLYHIPIFSQVGQLLFGTINKFISDTFTLRSVSARFLETVLSDCSRPDNAARPYRSHSGYLPPLSSFCLPEVPATGLSDSPRMYS